MAENNTFKVSAVFRDTQAMVNMYRDVLEKETDNAKDRGEALRALWFRWYDFLWENYGRGVNPEHLPSEVGDTKGREPYKLPF